MARIWHTPAASPEESHHYFVQDDNEAYGVSKQHGVTPVAEEPHAVGYDENGRPVFEHLDSRHEDYMDKAHKRYGHGLTPATRLPDTEETAADAANRLHATLTGGKG